MEQKLDEFAIKVRREYYRKWRAANKEKVRQHNMTYWQRQAEKCAKQGGNAAEVKNDGK